MSRKAVSSHPTLQRGQGVGASQEGSDSHSTSFESGVLVSSSLKEVSDLRQQVRFCVLFAPKEKLIGSRMD